MGDSKIGVVETRFAEIIWRNEPIGSRELAEICSKELNWKRPTTYNVLRKLCDKGIFQNVNGIVSSVLSRDEFLECKVKNLWRRLFRDHCLHLWRHLLPEKSYRKRKSKN